MESTKLRKKSGMDDDQAEGRRQMKRYIQEMYDPCESPDANDVPIGLVRYDIPIRMRAINRGNKKAQSCQGRLYNIDFPVYNLRELKEEQQKHRFSPYSGSDIEILLHNVRPRLDFRSKNHSWRMLVSKTPGSRVDIWHLKEKFPVMLIQSQAKNIGICYNRRKVHDECFDELIRQDILDIPERGVLMLRIRDEIRKSIGFLKHMFEGGKELGLKKAAAFSSGTAHFNSLNDLVEEQETLEAERQTLETQYELMKRKFSEESAAESFCHEKTCECSKATITQLQYMIELYKTPIIKMKGSTQSIQNVEKAWEKFQSRSNSLTEKPPLIIPQGKTRTSMEKTVTTTVQEISVTTEVTAEEEKPTINE